MAKYRRTPEIHNPILGIEPMLFSFRPLVLLALILGTGLFAAAYGQAPLYYSNQNQYFLHGFADAGVGALDEDWLAGTKDPLPHFSALVTFTLRYLHPWAFHLYYAVLMGVYAASLVALFTAVIPPDRVRRWPIFVAFLILIHAAVLRWASYRWLGLDYPWYFQAGVAGQYVLGAMFQPSTFGVFLIASVALFAHERYGWTAASLATAATLHSTYLLPAGLLTLGFVAALHFEKRIREAGLLGTLGLALVLPIVLFVLLAFGPTSPETFTRAQEILVSDRIPHHTQPGLWLDLIAKLQIAWIILGLILIRSSRLRTALFITAALAILLTLIQVGTGNRTLALLFPWRVSAVLMPVATAIILTRIVEMLPPFFARGWAVVTAGLVVVACAAGGVWICATRQGYHTSDDELPLLAAVREKVAHGDCYFLPVTIPTSKPGSLSSDFKPLAEKKVGDGVIPVDLQRFRLSTGAPIFVDFKSIPYKDVEVVEWRRRLDVALTIQQQMRSGDVGSAAEELSRQGITHVVVPAGQKMDEGAWPEPGREIGAYRVYRLSR